MMGWHMPDSRTRNFDYLLTILLLLLTAIGKRVGMTRAQFPDAELRFFIDH
jgi:hypothetical protein